MDSVETKKVYETVSGIPIKRVYVPEDVSHISYERDLGLPGEPPYVRGVYPNMYRERLWRIVQLSGYGTPEDCRERVKKLIEEGERGITFEQDRMVCYSMLDVDDPDVLCRREDIGHFGAPIASLQDLEILLEGIPLDKDLVVRWGMYPMQMSFEQASFFSVAQKRGIPLNKIAGQSHGCMMSAHIACPVYKAIPPRPANRFVLDGIEFCLQNGMDKWVPCTSAGNNVRGNGLNGYQELAMVFAQQFMRIDQLLERGRFGIDEIAPRLAAVNFAVYDDFFEEIAKIRAARRIWYKVLKEKYHAKNPRSLSLRIQGITCSSTFTYHQPLNNIVRNTSRTIAAALAGVQALGTASYDEAITVPSEAAAINAIRTQQIIQCESGINNVVDPLGGSYYVEWLTGEVEKRACEYLQEIENHGGLLGIIETGWAHAEAAKGAVEWERRIANGEWKWVGVNCFQMKEDPFQIDAHKPNPKVWEEAMARLEKLRKVRDNQRVKDVLAELRDVARGNENIIPSMIKAVQAGVTVGEVGNLWRELFGVWKMPLAM